MARKNVDEELYILELWIQSFDAWKFSETDKQCWTDDNDLGLFLLQVCQGYIWKISLSGWLNSTFWVAMTYNSRSTDNHIRFDQKGPQIVGPWGTKVEIICDTNPVIYLINLELVETRL